MPKSLVEEVAQEGMEEVPTGGGQEMRAKVERREHIPEVHLEVEEGDEVQPEADGIDK